METLGRVTHHFSDRAFSSTYQDSTSHKEDMWVWKAPTPFCSHPRYQRLKWCLKIDDVLKVQYAQCAQPMRKAHWSGERLEVVQTTQWKKPQLGLRLPGTSWYAKRKSSIKDGWFVVRWLVPNASILWTLKSIKSWKTRHSDKQTYSFALPLTMFLPRRVPMTHTHTHAHAHMHTHTHTRIYIYIHMYKYK